MNTALCASVVAQTFYVLQKMPQISVVEKSVMLMLIGPISETILSKLQAVSFQGLCRQGQINTFITLFGPKSLFRTTLQHF